MSLKIDSTAFEIQEKKRKSITSYNIITLALWGIVLASHAILVPKLIRELQVDRQKRRER